MKKLIFTIASIAGFAGLVSAQKMALPKEPQVNVIDQTVKKSTRVLSKTNISDWYNNTDIAAVTNVGNSLSSSFTFMYGDSNAKLMYQDGSLGHSFWMSIGHVMDPKDDNIGQTTNPLIKLSKFVEYDFDSVRFPFSYIRHVDSISDGVGGQLPVVDTLYVYYFKGTNIRKARFTSNGEKTPLIGYDHAKYTAKTFYTVDTLLLTKEDSTGVSNTNGFESSFSIKTITLAPKVKMHVSVNNGLDTNNLVGVAIVFKSMVKTVQGSDTVALLLQADPANFPNQKRGNCFGIRYLRNTNTAASLENPTYYNISELMPSWNAYGQNTNWKDNYVSGNAFVSDLFTDFDFHLTTTTDNVGINTISNNEFAMSEVYPNPAKSYEKAVVGFNLTQNANVSVSIMNLVGQEVKGGFNKAFAAGAHAEFIDLSGVKPGVYFVNMNVNGSSISKKLTVTE